MLIGAVKAQAQIISIANTNGVTPAGTIYGGQKIVAMGVSMTSATNSTFNQLQFSCTQPIAKYFTTLNIKPSALGYFPTRIFASIVRMDGAGTAYDAATGTDITADTTAFSVGTTASTLGVLTVRNFPTETVTAAGYSYFLVISFNVGGPATIPVPAAFKFTFTKINNVAITTPIQGYNYSWAAPSIITALGNNVPDDNGIQVNDIYFTQQKIGAYGFSIKVKNSRALIKQITVHTQLIQAPNGGFFQPTDVHLAENTGTDFRVPGSNTDIPTFNNPAGANGVAVAGNTDLTFYLNTPLDFNPAPGDSVVRNFFVYVNFNSDFKTYQNAVTFSLLKNGVGYTEIPNGVTIAGQVVNAPQDSSITGHQIGFATPTVMLTGQNIIGTAPGGNGISRTTQTFNNPTNNIVLYGFSLTNTGSQTSVQDLNLNISTITGPPFTTYRLYRSSYSKYPSPSGIDTLVASTLAPSGPVITTTSSSVNVIGFNEPLVLNKTLYYFLVGDWTNTTNTVSYQVTYKKVTFTSNGTTPAVLTLSNTDGQQFSLGVPEYDWEGAYSSDWTDKRNWYKNNVVNVGVPGNSSINGRDIVRIGVNKTVINNIKVAKNPIPSPLALYIGYLQIGKKGPGGSPSPVKLDLNGYALYVNNGLIVDPDATFTLNNSAATAAAFNIASLSTVASTGTIGFDPTTNPINVMKGSAAGAGTFTLLSDALGTGSIGAIPAGSSITGIFTVQRYLTGGTLANRAWRMLSSPVNNNSKTTIANNDATFNFASLRSNLFITGSNGNDNGFDQPAKYGANGPSILLYTTATSKLDGLATPPNSTNIPVGQGFYFYFRGDNIHNIEQKLIKKPQPTATNVNYAIPESVAALQTGTLNQGNLTYALDASGAGFNLVGNPYPSTINITTANIAATTPGTTGFIYIHSPAGNSINPQLPDASNPINIANGQAFYVKKSTSSPSASVVFTEALKTYTRPTTVLGKAAPQPLITLKMAQDTANFDITHLRFSDSFNKYYQENEDADDLNFYGQAVLFSAMTADNHKVGIASQPLNKQKTSVYLSVDAPASGDYSIQKMNLSAIPADYDVWLLDHFKHDSLDIRNHDIYQFSIDKKIAASYGDNRFEVLVSKRIPPLYALTGFTGQRDKASNLLKWNTVNEFTNITFEVQYSTDNKNFNTVKTVQSLGLGSYNITDANNTSAGYYRLKQTDAEGLIKYSVVVIIPAYNTGLDVFSVYPNPTADVLQFKTNEQVKTTVALNIYNNTGSLLKSATFNVNTGQLSVASLIPGFYSVELYDNTSKKTIASTKFIKQ